jgi:hypothetical protein
VDDEDATFSVYLDQNVYSRLREGEPLRENLLERFGNLATAGALFVYSDLHIEECRASDRPASFVAAFEAISASWCDFDSAAKTPFEPVSIYALEKLRAPWDAAEGMTQLIYNLTRIPQFAAGWSGEHGADNLRRDLEDEVTAFIQTCRKHDPLFAAIVAPMLQQRLPEILNDLDLQALRADARVNYERLAEKLPNFAQLDQMPDEDVVQYIFNCLDAEGRSHVSLQFPRGFWSDPAQRKIGAFTGFAFKLFMMGLTREKKVKSKGISKRQRYFIGQFRDCRHIENAARCATFMTFDKGAARLARATYAYAGIETNVCLLATQKGEPLGPPHA